MIVLDSSVLIGFMFVQDAHHAAAVRIVTAAAEQELGASPITWAEALVLPARAGRIELAVQMLQEIGVVQVPLGDRAAVRLAELRQATGLKMPDCCVLLAALQMRATVATFDGRLGSAAHTLGLPAVS